MLLKFREYFLLFIFELSYDLRKCELWSGPTVY